MKDTLPDIAFRITAYRHGNLDDAEYQASVLSILEEWERKRVVDNDLSKQNRLLADERRTVYKG